MSDYSTAEGSNKVAFANSNHEMRLKFTVACLIIFALFFTLVTQACANNDSVVEETRLPAIGYHAPDFTLIDLDGNEVKLDDFRGEVVFLNFWATWCPPCRAEMPAIEKAYQKYKDEGVTIIGIDLGEREDRVRQFVQQGGFNWTFAIDKNGQVSREYEVFSIPTSYFIDRDGIIREIYVGPMMTLRAVEANLAKAQ